jgi:hypothetical protein
MSEFLAHCGIKYLLDQASWLNSRFAALASKTERVQAGSRVVLRELLLCIRWRERLLEFAGGNDGAGSRKRGTLD